MSLRAFGGARGERLPRNDMAVTSGCGQAVADGFDSCS
jgi:hypothetical protein